MAIAEREDIRVEDAALADLRELAIQIRGLIQEGSSVIEPDYQVIMARMQIAQMALAMPEASVGACSMDGTPLSFRGRPDGLYLCCNGDPEHCWKNSSV